MAPDSGMSRRHVLAAGLAAGTATATGLRPDTGLGSDTGAPRPDAATGHPAGGTAGSITPAPVMPVRPGDSAARIVAKAANIVPRPAQVAWQRREVIAFTHYGMNTFTGREWGSGMEPESRFAPNEVDVDQWMRVYRDLGAELVILTAKHHDGFTLYPTRYTRHSVVGSPWWPRPGGGGDDGRGDDGRGDDGRGDDGRGDILGGYVRAARDAGLRVGVYLSPSDGAELPHQWHAETYIPYVRNKPESERSSAEWATLEDAPAPPAGHGRFGNGSAAVPRVIPTLVDGDDRANAVRTGELPSFHVTLDDYDAYYLNQVYELFTEYGPIDELWMDGANPWAPAGISQAYDFTTWFRVIAELSPETVVFQGPQGARWVGNEDGAARTSEWSVVPATADPGTEYNEFLIPGGAQAADIGSREVITGEDVRFLQWFPAEADFSIRPGWFHHADEHPKTPAQLVERYLTSVGRNAVMLLNVPPGPDGRIDQADHDSVTGFRRSIDATYGVNLLASHGPGTAGSGPSSAGKPLLAALTDSRLSTGWSPAGDELTGSLSLPLPRTATFDQIRLGEDITGGQRVEEFAVDVRHVRLTGNNPDIHATGDDKDGNGWTTVATGTTIGYSRIMVLEEPVTASHLRIRVLGARAAPQLAFVGLYRTAPPG